MKKMHSGLNRTECGSTVATTTDLRLSDEEEAGLLCGEQDFVHLGHAGDWKIGKF